MQTDYDGPLVDPSFPQMIAMTAEVPLSANYSGQMTADKLGVLIGSPRFAGRVYDIMLSVGTSGKDDTNPLSIAADVKINGTSICTTNPKISHISGEASQQKSTRQSGEDTGITPAVISDNDYNAGDVFTVDWDVTRTSSPTTEMANATLVISLRPD